MRRREPVLFLKRLESLVGLAVENATCWRAEPAFRQRRLQRRHQRSHVPFFQTGRELGERRLCGDLDRREQCKASSAGYEAPGLIVAFSETFDAFVCVCRGCRRGLCNCVCRRRRRRRSG